MKEEALIVFGVICWTRYLYSARDPSHPTIRGGFFSRYFIDGYLELAVVCG